MADRGARAAAARRVRVRSLFRCGRNQRLPAPTLGEADAVVSGGRLARGANCDCAGYIGTDINRDFFASDPELAAPDEQEKP